MASSTDGMSGKLIVDSVHGDIHLEDREWRILDTVPFQRLRRIKQLQMGQVTYPNATHTRFAHSIGSLGVMARILRGIPNTGAGSLKKRAKQNLRMAALVHDIGHYPYSHLMEGLGKVTLTEDVVDDKRASESRPFNTNEVAHYPDHEEVGKAIVLAHKDLITAMGGRARAREVADLFTRSGAADPQHSKLVHSSLDMDRMDYLQRDSQACGLPYGNIDINYLLNSLKISPTGMLGVTEKALPAAEQYLLARFFMHKTVYLHKTTFGIEQACKQLLRRMRDSGRFDMPRNGTDVLELVRSEKLAQFTDNYVDQLIYRAAKEGDAVMKALANSIEARHPPKLLKEVQVLVENGKDHHVGSTFWKAAKYRLERLADEFRIPLGQFLLCQTKPVKLESRGSDITLEMAKEMAKGKAEGQAKEEAFERKDELIKVFVNNESEPQSLVDIEHSLINKCSNHFWQAFRLYVVYEGTDKDEVIEKLRSKVANWDSAN